MTPIVKNAIQAVVPRKIIVIATARKTIPMGRNAVPRLRFARPPDSDLGFLSSLTWPTLRGWTGTRKRYGKSAAPERMAGMSGIRRTNHQLSGSPPDRIALGCALDTFVVQDRLVEVVVLPFARNLKVLRRHTNLLEPGL